MMKCKKNTFLLLSITCLIVGCQDAAPARPSKVKTLKEIEVRRYFSLYSHSAHGINISELHNPDNNPVLNACLTGAKYKTLERLGFTHLPDRLKRLQDGKIIEQYDGRYYLAFPVVMGQTRTRLQKLVEQVALQLLPVSEKIMREITPHLEGREEMLYHVLWSVIMDGQVAWNTAKTELIQAAKTGETTIENTAWLVYPRHPYYCGTNGYGDSDVQILITHSPNTPRPNVVYRTLNKYKNELIHSLAAGRPIENVEAKKALVEYGFVNDQGTVQVYVVHLGDINSEVIKEFSRLGHEFSHEVMAHLDIQKVADILAVSPGKALVIAYHELCYEVLKHLASRGTLDVPDIVLKSDAEASQMRRLVTLARVN